MNNHRRSWQENFVLGVDTLIIAFCYIAAYFMRFDGIPPEKHLDMMIKMLPLVLLVRLTTLFCFKLHRNIWRYASIKDLTQIFKTVSVSSVFIATVAIALQMGHPRSIFIIDWLLLIIGLS